MMMLHPTFVPPVRRRTVETDAVVRTVLAPTAAIVISVKNADIVRWCILLRTFCRMYGRSDFMLCLTMVTEADGCFVSTVFCVYVRLN